MRILNFIYLLVICASFKLPAVAQVLKDQQQVPNIRTVLFYNAKQEQSFPALQHRSTERLVLKFDDLASQFSNYTYVIQHCNSDWTVSSISEPEFLRGFNHNFITNYRFSSNTLQPYVHYMLELPNTDVQFILSGNYIIKVFNAADESNPVFVRRFIIYQNVVQVELDPKRSTVVNDRNKKQKIDFRIVHPEYRIDNPFDQLRVSILQNDSWEGSLYNTKPSFFDDERLLYDHVDANVFNGNSEHRRFDIRSTRFLAEGIARIDASEQWDVYLKEDKPKSPLRYVENFDMNGLFYISRPDMGNNEINPDYAFVHFTFDAGAQNPFGEFYILGAFNYWRPDENSIMTYNLQTKKYECSLYLKQGIYDYFIGFKSKKASQVDFSIAEGSFYETENNYRILVYYRKTGSRYDEVIGMREFLMNP